MSTETSCTHFLGPRVSTQTPHQQTLGTVGAGSVVKQAQGHQDMPGAGAGAKPPLVPTGNPAPSFQPSQVQTRGSQGGPGLCPPHKSPRGLGAAKA